MSSVGASLVAAPLDRPAALVWWRRNREWSRRLFAGILSPEAYWDRPIALRNPFIFYEGHLAAFPVNTLLRRGLGGPGIDAELEVVFERGIDPSDESAVRAATWPERERVLDYVRRTDEAIEAALTAGLPEGAPGDEYFRTLLEHEEMHQETLLYMLHRVPYGRKRRPADAPEPVTGGTAPARRGVRIPPGRATLGAARGEIPFGWDNEFPRCGVDVPAFTMDAHAVTNSDWLEFVEAGGYGEPSLWAGKDFEWVSRQGVKHPVFWERREGAWFWRGQFGEVPLPPAWPVYVSHAEASAYSRWKVRRLPTEAEYHRAAFGRPDGTESAHPWGEAAPEARHGNFGFARWDPMPAGSFPAGASAWGVEDLVGNGWEWTATPFAGFPGFRPMATYPAYSADFFDGRHFVMKGASPATAVSMVRRTFRNWFQTHYPFPYAKFRTVAP
jgi:ergothioneine biosynthesis protein EgtB